MKPFRWGYEDTIVDRPEATAKRIMVKGQYETPRWRASRDTTIVVGQGAVWMEHGEAPKSLSGMWVQENDRVHLDKDSWFRLTGMMDTILYSYSYGDGDGDDDEEEKYLGNGGFVSDEDFRDLLLSYVMATNEAGGILSIEEAGDVAEALAKNGRLVGMCNGCFDLIHAGHAELLLQAKQRCEILFVALNTDSSVGKLKGDNRPAIGEEGRTVMLSSMKFVDFVVMNEATTCVEAVKAVKPDVYITTPPGADGPEAKATLAIGGRVEVIDPLPGWSTTKILNKILEAR